MMTKIVFVGAGSHIFTRRLARDILCFPRLSDATIVLYDVDQERLDHVAFSVRRIVAAGAFAAQVVATTNIEQAIEGADYVICTIAGPYEQWRHDIEIPAKYGVDINIGDTRGPSGIFRFLRLYPAMRQIAQTMERLAPRAVLLNYTNPMAMICGALSRDTNIRVVGLCHSVQGTAEMLAKWLQVPFDELEFQCAGINHMAWYTQLSHHGVDLYPKLRAAMERPDIYNEEIVRNELFNALGYYTTESSGHHSEYNWWFRKRPELIAQYCDPGTGWNPGVSQAALRWYATRMHQWRDEALREQADPQPVDLTPSNEYAAAIINALAGGAAFTFNGNVSNRGYISNLPDGACVEVPIQADATGLHPVSVGALPIAVTLLTNLNSQIEELAITGCLTGDRNAIYLASYHDPLCAARLSLAEIRSMVDDMFAQSQANLPQFS
jgi:alpha-galactosidase